MRARIWLVLGTAIFGGCASGPGCGTFGAAGDIRFAKTVTTPNLCQVTATYTNRENSPAHVQLRVLASDSAGHTVTEQPLLFSSMQPGESKTTEIVDAHICDVTSVSVPLAEKMADHLSLFPGTPICGVAGTRAQLQ